MGLGKKHEVKPEPKQYNHLIIGDKKVGKSSIVANIVRQFYGGLDNLLIVSVGNEKAYEAIDGAVYVEPQNWTELMDIVNELSKNPEDNPFDWVSFDTIDQIIPMAEKEVMRLHAKEYKEMPKTFNASFGGLIPSPLSQ